MSILVMGASGFLGDYFKRVLSHDNNYFLQRVIRDASVYLLSSSGNRFKFDEPNFKILVEKVFAQVKPTVVINCIALISAERCELNPLEAHYINSEIPSIISHVAKNSNTKMIQISTDAVFAQSGSNFRAEQKPIPRSVYGKSKLSGENSVLKCSEKNLVVRTNFYGYSHVAGSLFNYFYNSLKLEGTAVGFMNQIFSPMYIEDLVRNIIVAIEGGARGVIHMAGGAISKYDLGLEIANQMGLARDSIIPVEYKNPEHGPYRNLDISLNPSSSREFTKFHSSLENGVKKSLLQIVK
jgi:dTDP-4-dehydrorhamnose reductase